MVQRKYPETTIEDASYTKDGAATAHECIDDPIDTPNDSTKVSTTSGDPIEVGLAAPDDPNESYDAIQLRIRARMAGSVDTCDVDAILVDAGEDRAVLPLGTMTDAWVDYALDVDFVAVGIFEFSQLSVRLVPSKPTTDALEFSSIELVVPDRRAHVHVST